MDPHSSDTADSKIPVNELAPLPPFEPTRIRIPGFGSIYRRGMRWAVEFWKGGVQHRESARTKSEQEAIAHLRKRVEELAQGKYVSARTERVTVADLLKLVTADYAIAGNRSGRTLKYRVAALTSELGHLSATKISPSTVEAYKAKRLSEGKARATINRELACLRRAYRLAERSRPPLISANSIPSIEPYSEDNVRQAPLDYRDYVALLAHLPAPIADAVAFAYLTGWRRAEVLGLTWREVDRARALITLPPARPQNAESRELPLSPTLSGLIEKRWQPALSVARLVPVSVSWCFIETASPSETFGVRGGKRWRLSASLGFCSTTCDARLSLTSCSLASGSRSLCGSADTARRLHSDAIGLSRPMTCAQPSLGLNQD